MGAHFSQGDLYQTTLLVNFSDLQICNSSTVCSPHKNFHKSDLKMGEILLKILISFPSDPNFVRSFFETGQKEQNNKSYQGPLMGTDSWKVEK